MPQGEQHEDSEIGRLRDRVHKLADMIQAHDGTLIEHRMQLQDLKERIDGLCTTTATSQQLAAAVDVLTLKLDHNATTLKARMENDAAEVNQKLDALGEKISPLWKGVFWVGGIVAASVILAILGLVLKGGVVH